MMNLEMKIEVTRRVIDQGMRYLSRITGDRLVRCILSGRVDEYHRKYPLVFEELSVDRGPSIHLVVREGASESNVDEALRGLFDVIGDSFAGFIGPVGRQYFVLAYKDLGVDDVEFLPSWLKREGGPVHEP